MARNQSQVLVDMLGMQALKLSEMTARAETAEALLATLKAAQPKDAPVPEPSAMEAKEQ